MVSKRLSRAYTAPVPAGQVVNWIGSPPNNAGVLPLNGQGFNGEHFPELLEQHGDAVLPNKVAVDGIHTVVGHGQHGEVHIVTNETTLEFDEHSYDFEEPIFGFKASGDVIIVWANNGKVWGSTDGGVNFTSLPLCLNSGATSGVIGDIVYGNGVWVAIYGNNVAICRSDILVASNWQPMSVSFGGLYSGITAHSLKMATDGKGNWFVGGLYHQFAWTKDDWLTINITEKPTNSNISSIRIPCNNNYYHYDSFVWCSDDGVFFAGSERSSVNRSDDGGHTWTAIAARFNSGYTSTYAVPQSIVDLGSGHYMVMYNNTNFAESFDRGRTWVKRSSYLGLGSAVYNLAADKRGMLLVTTEFEGNTQIHTSKDSGQTFDAGVAHLLYSRDYALKYWRDAWYGVDGNANSIRGNILVRSLKGYTRTEWEVK